MTNEIVFIPKEIVEKRYFRKHVKAFWLLSSTRQLLRECDDKVLERIYQNGGRPPSGAWNDPEGHLSETEKIHWQLKQSNIPLAQQISEYYKDANMERHSPPPATFLEWLFERFCIDLKLMSQLPKEQFFDYLVILDEQVDEAEKEVKELGERYNLNPEMAFSEKFFAMSPPEHAYFTRLLTKAALRSIRKMLTVIYFQWYPDDTAQREGQNI